MKNGPYELVLAPNNYPGKKYRDRYCYEHHLSWWKNTGEIIKEDEVIHHRNGNKRDNRFQNLEKLSNSKHSFEHVKERYPNGETIVNLECGYCKEIFSRFIRHVNHKVSNGQTVFFCSRSCGSKYQFKK